MRRGAALAVALLGLPAPVLAVPVWLEPASAGLERLDSFYSAHAGVASRNVAELGIGAALGRMDPLQLGVRAGYSTAATRFGLLQGPEARLEQSRVELELRYRIPVAALGWTPQIAAGGGRLRLAYHPDRLHLDVGGTVTEVSLPPETAWTRHAAAELLHALPANGVLALRFGCRVYGLDVATPEGTRRRNLRDLQGGMSIRVAVF